MSSLIGSSGANAVCDSASTKTELQSGSTSGSGGSTSLAQKGAVSELLSAAVDNGGLQREVSGTSVTFRGKPLGLIEAINKQYDFFSTLAAIETDQSKNFFNRFSFALTFNTDRGGVQNTLLANSQQLQSWSGRVEIVNQRDAHRRQYAALWRSVSGANASVGQSEVDALKQLQDQAKPWTEFNDWEKSLDTLGKTFDAKISTCQCQDPTKLEALIADFKAQLQTAMSQGFQLKNQPANLSLPGVLGKVLNGWKKLDTDANKVMDYAQKGQLVTFDWTTQRDPNLPDLFSNTVVYEASPWKQRAHDFTLNAAADWYRSP